MGLLGDLVSAATAGYDMVKAEVTETIGTGNDRPQGGPLMADPFVWALGAAVYKEKPSRMGYETLRYLCSRDTILAAIIYTRLGQLQPFCRPNLDEDTEVATGRSNGFRVRLKRGAGERTRAAKKREEEFTNFVHKCARPDVPMKERRSKDGIVEFVTKFARDRLEFDQPVAFFDLDRAGSPRQMYAFDGGTVRHSRNDDYPYVQVFKGQVVTRFREEEIMFCPQNLTSSIRSNGYSIAESEIAARMVQAHLGIDETNARQFQPGSMPKGLLTLTGNDISKENMRTLEAKYKSQVATFRGKHRLPLLPISRGGKLEFIHFPQANDIEFGRFLDYLVNLISALYRIDPVEINFPNRSGGIAGGSPGMIQSSPEATRLTASHDKGLRTLVDYLERCFDHNLIPLLDPAGPDFEFQFVGFDRQSEGDRVSLDDQKSRVYMSVNEVRDAHGMEPIEGGDIIRDPQYMQAMQQQQQQNAEMQGVGEDGDFAGGADEWANPAPF